MLTFCSCHGGGVGKNRFLLADAVMMAVDFDGCPESSPLAASKSGAHHHHRTSQSHAPTIGNTAADEDNNHHVPCCSCGYSAIYGLCFIGILGFCERE